MLSKKNERQKSDKNYRIGRFGKMSQPSQESSMIFGRKLKKKKAGAAQI
jgi:hypothetical protein